MVQPQDDQQLPCEEITRSPFEAQLLEFCESELFPETMQHSEVASTSNCCYEDQSSFIDNSDVSTYNTIMENDMRAPIATARDDNLSIVFTQTDDQTEINDISKSIDFTALSPSFSLEPYTQHISNQLQFNISSLGHHFSLDMLDGPLHPSHQYASERQQSSASPPTGAGPILGPPLPATYCEDEFDVPSVPSYLSFRSSLPGCATIDPMTGQYLPSGAVNAPFSAESFGIYAAYGSLMGTDLPHQELEFQGESGEIFMPESIPNYASHGGASTAPLTSEISSLDQDPSFTAGKMSVEERKRKIHRYMKKRNERNFSKKIKYACRKTLADSRPRVRGRFAKNDELGDIGRSGGRNHEADDIDEEQFSLLSTQMPPDHQCKVVVREETDVDASDILAHMGGVNSFKWYPIQSWI